MSKEWPTSTFADLIAAGTLQIGDGYRAKNEELGGTGPIFLRAGHVTDTAIDFTGVERFHAHLAETVANKMARQGDAVVTTKGNSTGRVTFIHGDMPPFVYSPHLSYWRSLDLGRVVPRYLYYWSKSEEFTTQLGGMSGSTDMAPYLSLTDQRRLRITLPPVRRQKWIANLLGSLDDKIDLNRRMNETLEALARSVFRSWFVDFDPVRAKADGRTPAGMDAATAVLFPDRFEDSSVGPIPEGWMPKPISDVTEGIYDGPHATPREADEGAVFLGIKNLTGTQIDLSDIRHIAEADWPRWTRRVTPRGGDIVFSYEAALGLFALIPPDLRCCLGRRLALVRPDSAQYVPHFLFHTFTAEPFRNLLVRRTVPGSTVDRIPLLDFPNFLITWPGSLLIQKFEYFAARLWQRIHNNQSQIYTLATIRDALLPRLLSGELRVPEAEAIVGAAT